MVRKQIHTYTVKSFECDRNDTLRLLTLLNLFQDIADDSANEIGIGYDYLRTVGKAWILIAMNVEIDRMPHLQEEITLTESCRLAFNRILDCLRIQFIAAPHLVRPEMPDIGVLVIAEENTLADAGPFC